MIPLEAAKAADAHAMVLDEEANQPGPIDLGAQRLTVTKIDRLPRTLLPIPPSHRLVMRETDKLLSR